jgi:integrase
MKISDLTALEYQQEHNAGRGLRAKKNKDGSCSFLLMKKPVGEKVPLRLKLGTWPEMSINEAEIKAQSYRKLIEEGIHPRDYEKQQAHEKHLKKQEEERKGITLRKLHEEYMHSRFSLEKHTANSKKSQNNVMLQVWEEFLDDPIQEITGPRLWDYYQYWVSQRISKQTGKPAVNQIKKGLRYLKAEFNYAIRQKKYLTENPCDVFAQQISLQAGERNYYLQPRETEELFDWIDKLIEPDPEGRKFLQQNYGLTDYDLGAEGAVGLDLVALELLTGLRQVEVRQLRWAKVYMEKEEWEEEDANGPFFETVLSKQKKSFGVPITNYMKAIFQRRQKHRRNDYVFPSWRNKSKPLSEDRHVFDVVKKVMPVSGLRKTDALSSNVLRHTFATHAQTVLRDGQLVDMITGHYTKHRRGVATYRYVHLEADAHRPYFQEVNDFLLRNHPKSDELEKYLDELDAEGHDFQAMQDG